MKINPHPYAGLLVMLALAASSVTLPVRLMPEAFASKRAAAMPGAMTIGCAEASCCSARCYLDESGVHHCVPAANRSCTCGFSSGDRSNGQASATDLATLPVTQGAIAQPGSYPLTGEVPEIPATADLSPLSPPPRA